MAFLMGKDPDAKQKKSETGVWFALGLERGRIDAEKKYDEKKKEEEERKKKRRKLYD